MRRQKMKGMDTAGEAEGQKERLRVNGWRE